MTSEVMISNGGGFVNRYDQQEVIQTIKQTVCKGATDAQLRMFLEVCKRTGLDPFLKEIWFVAEKGMIMAGRDGYLRVANEHPMFDGIDTRVERDEKNVPIKAVCSVWRKDRSHPTTCEAYYSEYRGNSPVWSKYPSAMISKVAEVLALKRSFSINGIVTEEEIGEQGSSAAAQDVAQRKIEAGRKAQAAGASPTAAMAEVPVLDAEVVEEPLDAEDHAAAKAHLAQFTGVAADAMEHPPKDTKAPTSKLFDALKAFGDLKKRYQAIGKESSYYAALGRLGYQKSNEITDIKIARAVYKELSLNISDLEVWVKEHPEQRETA